MFQGDVVEDGKKIRRSFIKAVAVQEYLHSGPINIKCAIYFCRSDFPPDYKTDSGTPPP
jgi:hypothetical protein